MVVAVNPSGRLTVRCPSSRFATEGTRVVDRSGTLRGEVARVFGPVRQPYLSIRLRRMPRAAEAAALVGTTLSGEES
nr:H/ACA RNA-protein complex component Gar1 [Thermoplasmata archaeon]